MTANQSQHINRVLLGIVVSIFAFLAHRVYIIESNHLSHIEKDLAVQSVKMENVETQLDALETRFDAVGEGIMRIELALDTIKNK